MNKRKTSLIINPRDGMNIAKLTNILAVLAASDHETRVALKEYGGHTEELARQAAKEDNDLIVAYGGDGTVNQVVNGVMNAQSKSVVGVIPGGTANLWATEIGMPTDDPVKAALALLDSEARSVDIGHVTLEKLSFPADLQIDNKKHKKQKSMPLRSHFLLMAGLGLDAMVMQGVSKPLKHKIKQLAVGLSAAKEIPAYRPFQLRICDADHKQIWEGEALQVIVGNTRLYADILHMTPDAYIDDGKLDVCIITGGNFMGTIQQIFSLLLRHQPDDLTAEYCRDSRLYLQVSAQVALQFDGSAIKLKDLLSKAQKRALKATNDPTSVMVEYCFEALPQSLRIVVPRTYDNTLFEEDEPHEKDEPTRQNEFAGASAEQSAPPKQAADASQHLSHLRAEGRTVNVAGVGFDTQHGRHLVVGTFTQQATGVAKPAAVRVDHRTTILNDSGEKLTPSAVQKLQTGNEIIVSGKKSKRGVIQAEHMII